MHDKRNGWSVFIQNVILIYADCCQVIRTNRGLHNIYTTQVHVPTGLEIQIDIVEAGTRSTVERYNKDTSTI